MAGEDTNGRVSFPAGAGQLQPAPSQGQLVEGGGGTTDQPLTRSELLQILGERDERLFREVQSRTDKTESRIDKRIRADIAALEKAVAVQRKAGIEITDDQVRAARQQIYDQAYTQQDDPTSQADPSRQPVAQPGAGGQAAPSNPVADFVNQRMDKIFQKHGVEITEEEARAAGLLNIRDPHEFLDKLEDLTIQKAKTAKTPPAARIPTMGSGAATNLQAQYEAEKAKIRRGDALALQKLKIKYREQGLDV